MGQRTQKSPSWQFWKCFHGLFHVPYNISQIKQICSHEDLSDAALAAFIHSPMFSLNVAHSLQGLNGLSSFTAAWGSFGSAKRKLIERFHVQYNAERLPAPAQGEDNSQNNIYTLLTVSTVGLKLSTHKYNMWLEFSSGYQLQ